MDRREDSAPSILTNLMSEDVTALNGMTTETVATLTEVSLELLLGVLIALIFLWRMALVTVACFP